MAWTTPATWTPNQLVTATDLNQQIRDNMTILAVPVDTATGKISALSSSTLADLSGANLTGVVKTASANTLTAKNTYSGAGRLVIPTGADKWGT
jgi:hypothetical protein